MEIEYRHFTVAEKESRERFARVAIVYSIVHAFHTSRSARRLWS